MNDIEIVFFDAGGTLLEPHPPMAEVYSDAGRRYGLRIQKTTDVVRAFRAAFRHKKLDGRAQDRTWWREVVDATFARFGEASDPDALFEDLYTHFHHPSSWRPFDDAGRVVRQLRDRGYRTGLLSNWDDRLPHLLDGLGLLEILDPAVISYQVGVEKPDRRIFETALARADVEAHRALMVGDDWEADVLGARATGMRTVFVERYGHRAPDGTAIESLGDLLDLLACPQRGRQAM